MERNFTCINGCVDSYNFKNPHIIFVNNWDHVPYKEELRKFESLAQDDIFACWKCPSCEWVNSVDWRKCVFAGCGHIRLEATSPTEYHGVRPYDPRILDEKAKGKENNKLMNQNNGGWVGDEALKQAIQLLSFFVCLFVCVIFQTGKRIN